MALKNEQISTQNILALAEALERIATDNDDKGVAERREALPDVMALERLLKATEEALDVLSFFDGSVQTKRNIASRITDPLLLCYSIDRSGPDRL